MSDKQLRNSSSENGPPFNDFDLDIGKSRIISNTSLHKQADLIGKIKVKPREQRRFLIGSFTKDSTPKGFSIDFTPDPDPDGSVVTEVTSLGSSEQYRLVLHAANYGSKTVEVIVRHLRSPDRG